jgi:hypothetical protein
MNSTFTTDFDRAVKALKEAQTTVSSTKIHKNLINHEGQVTTLRFSAPVFEKRVNEIDHLCRPEHRLTLLDRTPSR